jgi:hypothetical protein
VQFHRVPLMIRDMWRTLAVAGLAIVLLSASAAAKAVAKKPAKPLYYVQVMEALADTGVPDTAKPEARKQLLEALRARPEIVVAPEGGSPVDDATLIADLKKRKLRGLALSVRVVELVEEIKPPPEGKKSRVLQVQAKVAIFGSTIPADGLAIGGDGQSKVGLEIGKNILPGDRDEATKSALAQSLVQAIDVAIEKLAHPPKAPKPEKKKKK